jgi:molybdopterin-guanine dinucleotide biosynthesis protein A
VEPSRKVCTHPEDVTLAILCGGAGSRMGFPKGLLTIDGRPVLEYLIDQIRWPGPTLLVTAPEREHPPGWQRFDAEAVDPVADQGPLRGLLTALEHSTTPTLVALTADMPGVRLDHLSWDLNQLRADARLLGVMSRRTSEGTERVEPFPAALRASSARVLRRRLKAGRRSVHGLLEEPHFAALPAPGDWPKTVWTNLNTPQDLAAFSP